LPLNGSSTVLGEHGIERLHDEALLGLWQVLDRLDLLQLPH
jgi:hypothetical protein